MLSASIDGSGHDQRSRDFCGYSEPGKPGGYNRQKAISNQNLISTQ